MNLAVRARAARAEGRHLDAVDAWREALLGAPDDWRVALELKQDLKAAYHYPDSDPHFRLAARHLPDEHWLAHYSALYAFHGSDLDTLHARGTALLAHRPHDPLLHTLIGDIARQRRDWPGAVDAFTTAQALVPHDPVPSAKLTQARRYRDLTVADGGEPYAILALNLDRNAERWDELRRQFATSQAPLHRLAGIEGARLAGPAVQRLTGDAQAPRGTLGCFLSHAAAWQAVIDRNLAHALVVEDDVIPLIDLPARIVLPPDYAVCFANDRLDAGMEPDLTAHPFDAVMAAFPVDDNAPGGDGYFVSQAGARALLDRVAADGFAGDVDWRLVAYGLSQGAPLRGHAAAEIARLQAILPNRTPLPTYALWPALIRTVGVSSDREDQNRLAEGRR